MIVRTPTDVGALIRQRRRALQLDQRSLAERVGVSRQWLIDVERGKPRAELGLILRTLDALGVRLQVGERLPAGKGTVAARVPDIDAIIDGAKVVRR